jgi:hypothetical protein
MNEDKIVRVHCNHCGQKTQHAVRATYTADSIDSSIEEAGDCTVSETFEILQCLGCENMVACWTGEHEAFGTAGPNFYPPPISRHAPLWQHKLPPNIYAVSKEIYKALQNDSPRLATMGARTVVDLVILDKIGDVGTFQEKLAQLEKKGYVGKKNQEFLGAALEAGNAAAHRGLALKPDELNHVIDIVENLLEAVYVLEEAANNLRKATPPRAKRKSGS